MYTTVPRQPEKGCLFTVDELVHLSANEVASITLTEARAHRAAVDNSIGHTAQVVELLDKSTKGNIKATTRQQCREEIIQYLSHFPSKTVLHRHVIPRVTGMIKTSSKYKHRKSKLLTAWFECITAYERASL